LLDCNSSHQTPLGPLCKVKGNCFSVQDKAAVLLCFLENIIGLIVFGCIWDNQDTLLSMVFGEEEEHLVLPFGKLKFSRLRIHSPFPYVHDVYIFFDLTYTDVPTPRLINFQFELYIDRSLNQLIP
jgi:hypothetical protein